MTERPTSCPLCEFSADSAAETVRHLQVAHRKRTLAEALLDAAPARAKSPLPD